MSNSSLKFISLLGITMLILFGFDASSNYKFTNNLVFSYIFSIVTIYLINRLSKTKLKVPRISNKLFTKSYESGFTRSVLEAIHYLIIIFFIDFFIPHPKSFITKFIFYLFFISLLFWLFRVTRVFYRQIKISRTSKTLITFKFIVASILLRYLLEIFDQSVSLNYYIGIVFKILDLLLILFIVAGSMTIASNNNWIHYLKRNEKRELFWSILIFNFILTIILFAFYSTSGDSFKHFNSTAIGSPILVTGNIYLLLFVGLRFAFTCLFSFSSSDVVEKKQTELTTLTYINSVISKTKDLSEIVKVINKLTQNYTESTISTVSLFAEHLEEHFRNTQGTSSVRIIDLEKNPNYINNISELKEPVLVNSIYEQQQYYFIIEEFPMIRSFIYIPIYLNEKLIGNILILNSNEYHFEGNETEILLSFADNLKIAIENSKLDIETKERERLQSEFEIAKKMQEKLLPNFLPETDHYKLDGFSIPAEEVGGDFFDFLTLKNGNKCVIQGDVSGKGIGASFFMAQIKGVAMSLANESGSIFELLCKINTTLYGSIESRLFATMACLEFDNFSEKVSYCRAGHTPLAVFKNSKVEFIKPKGIGIGIANSSLFDNNLETIEIIADKIFCFTDGINELKNSAEQEFGFDRIKELMEKFTELDPKKFNSNLVSELNQFSNNTEQHDDMTVITIIKKELNDEQKIKNRN